MKHFKREKGWNRKVRKSVIRGNIAKARYYQSRSWQRFKRRNRI